MSKELVDALQDKAKAAVLQPWGSAERQSADAEVAAILATLKAIKSLTEETKEMSVKEVKPGAALAAAKQILGETPGYLRTTGTSAMGYPKAFNLYRDLQRLRAVIKETMLKPMEQVALAKWAVSGDNEDPFAAAINTRTTTAGETLDFDTLVDEAAKRVGQQLDPQYMGRRIYSFVNAQPQATTGEATKLVNRFQALYHLLDVYHGGYGGGEASMIHKVLATLHPKWQQHITIWETIKGQPPTTFQQLHEIIGVHDREAAVMAEVDKEAVGSRRDVGSVFVASSKVPDGQYRNMKSVPATVTLPAVFLGILDKPCRCGKHQKVADCYPCFSKVVDVAKLNAQAYGVFNVLRVTRATRTRLKGYLGQRSTPTVRQLHGLSTIYDVFYDTACQDILTGDPHILPAPTRCRLPHPYRLDGIGTGICHEYGTHPVLGKVLWVEGLTATLLPHAKMVPYAYYYNSGPHKGGIDLTLRGSIYEFRILDKMLSLTGARYIKNAYAALPFDDPAEDNHATAPPAQVQLAWDYSTSDILDFHETDTEQCYHTLDPDENPTTTSTRAYLAHNHKNRLKSKASRLGLLREYHAAMGHCGVAAMRDVVKMGAFPGIRINDVDRWEKEGKCQACTAAKMGHHFQKKDDTAGMATTHGSVGMILQADLFYFLGARRELQAALLTVDEATGFKMGRHLQQKTTTHLGEALREITQEWRAMGHTVRRIITDRENNFVSCDATMADVGVELKRTSPGAKCAMVERGIRTIKDRARATYLGMREKIPSRYFPALMMDTIYMDRYTPSHRRGGGMTTPYAQVSPIQDGVDRLNRAVDCSFGEAYHWRLPESDRLTTAPALDVLRSDVGYVVGRDTHADHTYRVYFPRDGATRQCGTKVPGEPDIYIRDQWRRMREEDAIPLNAAPQSPTLKETPPADLRKTHTPLRWHCPRSGCTTSYNHTSTRSIHNHAATCGHSSKPPKKDKRGRDPIEHNEMTMQQEGSIKENVPAEETKEHVIASLPPITEVPLTTSPAESGASLTEAPTTSNDLEHQTLTSPAQYPSTADEKIPVSPTRKSTRSGRGYPCQPVGGLAYVAKTTDNITSAERKWHHLRRWSHQTPRVHQREEATHQAFMARLLQVYNLRVRKEKEKGPTYMAKLKAAHEAEALNFEKYNSFDPIPWSRVPYGAKIGRCTAVLTVKRDPHDEAVWKYKVRGVYNHARARTKGRTTEDANPTDNEADFYAPTSKYASVSTILNVATARQMNIDVIDINAAFLHSPVKGDYYMEIDGDLAAALVRINPRKYSTFLRNGKLLVKLKCSIYGLPEASQLWFQLLSDTLKQLGFTQHSYDPAVFYKREGKRLIIVCGHVDDLLTVYNDAMWKTELFHCLETRFGTKQQEGEQLMYLGIEICKVSNGQRFELHLNQHRYEQDVLRQYGFESTATTTSPYACGNFFIADKSSPRLDDKDMRTFRTKVAQLNYLGTRTRPLLSVGVSYLSGRGGVATVEDMAKVDRMLRYVADSADHVVRIAPANDQLQGYADASYASHESDNRRASQLGYVITMGGSFITARSTKTKTTCDSATAAELMALHVTLNEILWLRKFLNALGVKQHTTTLYEDNDGAMKLAQMKTGNLGLTKHVDIKFFTIRDSIDNGDVRVEHVPTKDMLADGFTKALPRGQYQDASRRVHRGILWRQPGRPPIGTSREPIFLDRLGKAMMACAYKGT